MARQRERWAASVIRHFAGFALLLVLESDDAWGGTLPTQVSHDPTCVTAHRYPDSDLYLTEPSQLQSSAVQSGVLGDIRIFRQDIFPGSRRWLYVRANRWHVPTKERVIVDALPFVPGDAVSSADLDEAERLLRARPYFFDARVLPRTICRDRVDIDIVVREVWTLTPALSLTRSGGESDAMIGLADSNWRGTGRRVALVLEREPTHTGVDFTLQDPVYPKRWARDLSLTVADKREGFRIGAHQPFYALDTPMAQGVSLSHSEVEQSLYLNGHKVLTYDVERNEANLYAGRRLATESAAVIRGFLGLRLIDKEVQLQDSPAETQRYRFRYPYLRIAWLQNDFTKVRNLGRIGLVEDLNLGWEGWLELGVSTQWLDASANYLHFNSRLGKRWLYDTVHYLSTDVSIGGRLNTDTNRSENVLSTMGVRYLYKASERWRTHVAVELAKGENLDTATTLQLGGRTGLRGFPRNYQAGSKRYTVSLEQRLHTRQEPLDLFRMAYVAFVDVGRSWYSNRNDEFGTPETRGVIADVGVGIRLESIRTGSKRVLHIDVARPVRSDNGTDGYEFGITVRQGL